MSSSLSGFAVRTDHPVTVHATAPEITLFVACYNEAPNILATLETVQAALRRIECSYEVIVIDDASTDDSAEVVREYQSAHPDVALRLCVNQKNRGLARNFIAAAALGRGKYFKLVCGDNVESEQTLVNILGRRGTADLVLPYHTACPGKTRLRLVLSRVFTWLVNRLSGHRVKYYNGLPLHLRHHVLRWPTSTSGFGFQADLVTRLLDTGASYAEVLVEVREREQGASNALTLRNFLAVGQTLLHIGLRRLRRLVQR
jgi:glycosyltransferase involved in cell wall biosynthesis